LEKSLKKRQNSRSRSNCDQVFLAGRASDLMSTAVCALCVAAVFFCVSANAAAKKSAEASSQTETYQNLIEKAQNLSLQKDRLQASQILIRGIAHESKVSTAYKELTRTLDELMTTFYTERAQSAFVSAESNVALKPKDAIEGFTEALHLEDGNVTILKALARTHLILSDCDKADGFVKSAEALDPYAPEVLLLRLQVLDCSKSTTILSEKLFPIEPALAGQENFIHGLQIKDLLRRTETKRAKALQAQWESASPDYPEVYYWKWMISKEGESSSGDHSAAQKYVQLCQNLTPRKRKSYNLDVDLCKGKDDVAVFLKEPPHEN
jgi:hypothetical protein